MEFWVANEGLTGLGTILQSLNQKRMNSCSGSSLWTKCRSITNSLGLLSRRNSGVTFFTGSKKGSPPVEIFLTFIYLEVYGVLMLELLKHLTYSPALWQVFVFTTEEVIN